MRILTAASLMLVAGVAHAQTAADCSAAAATVSPHPTAIVPLAPELALPSGPAGMPADALATPADDSLTVDAVLARRRLADCLVLARAAPAGGSAAPAAGYRPQTQFDNTPWRFDMSQNGKRMTAAEFDAWMKARGVRVAKGAPGAPVAPPPAEKPKDEPKK